MHKCISTTHPFNRFPYNSLLHAPGHHLHQSPIPSPVRPFSQYFLPCLSHCDAPMSSPSVCAMSTLFCPSSPCHSVPNLHSPSFSPFQLPLPSPLLTPPPPLSPSPFFPSPLSTKPTFFPLPQNTNGRKRVSGE
eukprot:RCo030517